MSLFHAVGVGALNVDLFFEVTPEQLIAINSGIDKPFFLGREDSGKPEEFEQIIQAVEEHAKPIGQALGGSAAQTITALSRMGFRTGYLGMVGYDGYGQFLRSSLEKEGIDSSRVFVGGIGSGVCLSLSDGRDRALRVFPNSNDLLGLRNLDALGTLEDYLGKSEIVHMTSFVCSLKDKPKYNPLEVQKKIAEQLDGKVMISFALGELYARLGLEVLQPILRNTHILFLNRREMQMLTGEDYREGSRKLLKSKSSPRFIVCTLGADGSYLRYNGGEFLAEPTKIPKSEIKTEGLTGAGDYFAAGFLAGLSKQYPPEYCMNLGNEVASMKLRGLEREAYQKVA